jgi:hypothetical protein
MDKSLAVDHDRAFQPSTGMAINGFKPGDRVVVVDGTYRGMTGTVVYAGGSPSCQLLRVDLLLFGAGCSGRT